ncbi:MAG: hypothetical protein EAZ44_04475 [Cytophagia bacterium]|nr:MAG: hypothetical protein EAZ44_04475 [Cytophagia bacterium]TAG38932.1 MAG: hypothetical protein EAZ31_09860 [Cytophagia bacterium]
MKKNILLLSLLLTNHFIFSQQKNVLDYFKIFQQSEEKKLINESIKKINFEIAHQDFENQFIEVYAKDADGEAGDPYLKSYQIAIFEAKNKKKIIVIFGLNCWTGCISNIDELYFFDENMRNITKKILPKQKIIQYFENHVEKGVDIKSAFLADINKDKAKITLYLSAYYLALQNEPPSSAVNFLVFDANKGRFKLANK